MASAVLVLLLGAVAVLTVWRATSDRDTRRSLEQRATVVAALNDGRAQFWLGTAFIATAILADDPDPFIDRYRETTARGELAVNQALAGLAALGDADGFTELSAFVTSSNDLGQGTSAFVDQLLTADRDAARQMALAYQSQQWPRAEAVVSDLEKLAARQQAKLTAEREAADRAGNAMLMLLVTFSMSAIVTGAAALLALSLSVMRPLASLQEKVRAITSGDLEAKATVSGPEEVASLARDFNAMIAARTCAEQELREARDKLEVRVQERTAALVAANEELERQARTDSLTQLANHRSLLDSLTKEIEASTRSGYPLTVLMIDIDGFKLFNDTYGHAIGDEVLKAVAGILRQVADDSQIAGRYGGDEFLVILPGADGAAASRFAERLVAAVGKTGFQADDGSRVPITLSMGAASVPEDTDSKDRLLALADTAMYEAKRLGGVDREGPRLVTPDLAATDGAFAALDSLVQAIQYRDHYTKTHSDVVAEYAVELALHAGLSDQSVRALRIAGVLHDVGKLIVPDDILKKPGALTEEEWEVVKRHPMVGEMLIRETPFLEDVIQAVGCHHERYDGAGYPRGLKGEDIPLLGRVLTIADAYSAMCLDRPYRKGLSTEDIIAEFKAGAGNAFDPRLADIFVEILSTQERKLAA